MNDDNQTPENFGQTPWQTVGPFFHYGLPWKGGADLVGQSDLGARPELFPEEHYVLNLSSPKGPVRGERIELFGAVFDASGAPLPDAMIEIWQANSVGRYASLADPRDDLALDEGFSGFGRSSTTNDGIYRFRTIKPGRVPGPAIVRGRGREHEPPLQAPHIAVGIFGRGIVKRLVTRVYFEDEASNADDPILALVPAERRATLIAAAVPESSIAPVAPGHTGGTVYRFDIHLQGDGETVFFAI